jgi:hypothetical protein
MLRLPSASHDTETLLWQLRETVEHGKRVFAESRRTLDALQNARLRLHATLAATRLNATGTVSCKK